MSNEAALLETLAVVGPLALVVVGFLYWFGLLSGDALAKGPGRASTLSGWDVLAALGLALTGMALVNLVVVVLGIEVSGGAGGEAAAEEAMKGAARGEAAPSDATTGDGSGTLSRAAAILNAVGSLLIYGLPAGYFLLRMSRWVQGPGVVVAGLVPRRPAGELGLGLLALVVVMPVMLTVSALVGLFGHAIGFPPPDLGHQMLRHMQQSSDVVVVGAIVVMAVVIAPVGEELVFRGLLQTTLLRYLGRGRRWAVVVGGAGLFTSVHFAASWQAVPAIFVLGIALGWLYERTGSLWPAVVLHLVYNAMQVTFVLTLYK